MKLAKWPWKRLRRIKRTTFHEKPTKSGRWTIFENADNFVYPEKNGKPRPTSNSLLQLKTVPHQVPCVLNISSKRKTNKSKRKSSMKPKKNAAAWTCAVFFGKWGPWKFFALILASDWPMKFSDQKKVRHWLMKFWSGLDQWEILIILTNKKAPLYKLRYVTGVYKVARIILGLDWFSGSPRLCLGHPRTNQTCPSVIKSHFIHQLHNILLNISLLSLFLITLFSFNIFSSIYD